MKKFIESCEFNIDTACVEVKLMDGSIVSIDCDVVEAEYANNLYETSELDYLIYNDPMSYVELLLSGRIKEYLTNSTDYTPLSDMRQIICNDISLFFQHLIIVSRKLSVRFLFINGFRTKTITETTIQNYKIQKITIKYYWHN